MNASTDISKESKFLNQRSDKFTIVLNDNEIKLFKSSRNIFLEFNTDIDLSPIFVAVIMHDRDTDENNVLKTKHYHVVLHLNKIVRIGTMINKICDMFHCHPNQVTIDKCNSICMQTRYLCHLDDFDKYPYLQCDISTNNMDIVNRYFKLTIIRDIADCVAVVKQYHYNLEDIMLNVSNYEKWRRIINDLIINYNRKF